MTIGWRLEEEQHTKMKCPFDDLTLRDIRMD